MSNRKYTYPDQQTTGDEIVESKFGRAARLSPRQSEATTLVPGYRVDHTLPQDVGAVLGLPVSGFGHFGLLGGGLP
jgi:hypothetical protein